MNADDIIIDREFEQLLPYTDATEDALLEQSIVESEGPTDPLVLWGDSNILIDGHRRLKVCKTHNLPFTVRREELESADDVRIWMLCKQLSRRNVQDRQRPRLVRELYDRIRDNKARKDGNAAEAVGRMTGITKRSVYRLLEQQRKLDRLIPGWQVQAERVGLSKEAALQVAECSESDQQMLLEVCVGERDDPADKRRIQQQIRSALDLGKKKKRVPLPFDVELPPGVELGEFADPSDLGKKATKKQIAEKIAETQAACRRTKRLIEELTGHSYVDSGVLRQRMLVSVSRVASCLKFLADHAHERPGIQ
jgi:hypothetical protein